LTPTLTHERSAPHDLDFTTLPTPSYTSQFVRAAKNCCLTAFEQYFSSVPASDNHRCQPIRLAGAQTFAPLLVVVVVPRLVDADHKLLRWASASAIATDNVPAAGYTAKHAAKSRTNCAPRFRPIRTAHLSSRGGRPWSSFSIAG